MRDGGEEVGEGGFFGGSEAGEDKIGVAKLGAEGGLVGAEAESGEGGGV